MKKRYGYWLMGLGVVLLCVAASLFLLNQREEAQASNAVARLSNAFSSKIWNQDTGMVERTDTMQTVALDGRAYIGKLYISSLQLTIPVMLDWSYEGMRTAPGRYAGSFLENNMIVAGHNYRCHFGRLNRLSIGDAVEFVDVMGQSYHYVVCKMEIIDGQDVEAMLQGDWDLTLFTCTYSGADRVTVRCKQIETY